MLSEQEVFTVLPAADLPRARAFYLDTLGMKPAEETGAGLMYRMPGGSLMLLYETANAGSAKNTAMCFDTTDLDAEMAELRQRGVTFEEFDFPGLKTENGVAKMENERSAWFVDSEGNILCLLQRL
ncbi:VOC family protein [Glaciibacter superstes]|uniref:VOC family protein n=1 Tax=Glaciibacter superstes TaxID=501023 RepID=UPI0003B5EB5B|nr:VOC family protein [Glaciibacter superstes]